MKFFVLPTLSMIAGLIIAGFVSWNGNPSIGVLGQTLLTVTLLSVLEISLSFDNAVVNATVLQKMDEVWKRRFLTWGMLIAVFGMRCIFPVLIVAVAANMSLYESFIMALSRPQEYADKMLAAHLSVASFGGAFLLMVTLAYFFSQEKEIHWIPVIEKPAAKVSAFQSIEIIMALVVLLVIYMYLPETDKMTFLISYLWGMITFLIVHGISDLLEQINVGKIGFLSSGFGMFLYLEVLDASFSFDGVVGAFAISTQLLIIMIGLGVGAFFVRGITLYLVENKTLNQFKFLEHGAFYALGCLALFMLLDSFFHFPEWLTALTGAAILALSIFWSIIDDRKKTAK